MLARHNALKVNTTLSCESDTPGLQNFEVKNFNTRNVLILQTTDLTDLFDEQVKQYLLTVGGI